MSTGATIPETKSSQTVRDRIVKEHEVMDRNITGGPFSVLDINGLKGYSVDIVLSLWDL